MSNTNFERVVKRLKEYINIRIDQQDGSFPEDHARIKCLNNIRKRIDELIEEETD